MSRKFLTLFVIGVLFFLCLLCKSLLCRTTRVLTVYARSVHREHPLTGTWFGTSELSFQCVWTPSLTLSLQKQSALILPSYALRPGNHADRTEIQYLQHSAGDSQHLMLPHRATPAQGFVTARIHYVDQSRDASDPSNCRNATSLHGTYSYLFSRYKNMVERRRLVFASIACDINPTGADGNI